MQNAINQLQVPEAKVVQVRVRPPHRRLDVFVQLVEGAVVGQYPPQMGGRVSNRVTLNW
jgi:hypothetical protein